MGWSRLDYKAREFIAEAGCRDRVCSHSLGAEKRGGENPGGRISLGVLALEEEELWEKETAEN